MHDNKTYDIYSQWVKIYETTVKPSTFLRVTKNFGNNIFQYFEGKYIDEITPVDCQIFAINLNEYAKGKETFNQAKRVMDDSLKMEYIYKNHFDNVMLPKFKEKKVMIVFLEVENVNTLLNYIEKDLKWYCKFRVLIYTGVRRGELLALEWSDIDFTNKTLSVSKGLSISKYYKTYVSTTNAKKSIRDILLDDKTLLS